MKKLASIMLLIAISNTILFSWYKYQNDVPALTDIRVFDPSVYEPVNNLQTFKLKPNDRQWCLSSVVHYTGSGQIESEQIYYLDEDGQSYYLNNHKQVNVDRMSREGFRNLSDGLSDWGGIPKVDKFGRPIFVEEDNPNVPELSCIKQLYYCLDNESLAEDEAVCTYVYTSYYKKECEEDRNKMVIQQDCCYYIVNFDKYGNTISRFYEGACFMKTDAKGYLQMIISKNNILYYVTRVDEYGRPMWMATYDQNTGGLLSYTVWNYKLL